MDSISSSDGMALLNEIKKFIEKIFKSNMSTVVRSAYATVISIAESELVTVRLTNSPSDGSQDLEVRNQSGEPLVANDAVLLYYTGDYTNAYIVIRNWVN
jgi:hypothetical protein